MAEAAAANRAWAVSGYRPFVEQEEWERGFAAVFDAKILPQLGVLELARLRRRRQILICRLVGLFSGLFAVGLFVLMLRVSVPEILLEIAGGMVIVAGLLTWFLPFLQVRELRQAYGKDVAAVVLPPVLDFVGGITHADKAAPEEVAALAEFERLGLLPFANKWKIDDLLRGQEAGGAWEMAEIVAIERREVSHGVGHQSGHRETEVYRGIVARLPRPGAESQTILLISPTLCHPPEPPAGTQRLVPEQSPLAGSVVAWAEDGPALARCIPPVVEAGLAKWVASLAGQPFALAFAGNSLDLLLPSKVDHFTAGNLGRSVAEIEADLHRLLAEVTLPRRLLAALAP